MFSDPTYKPRPKYPSVFHANIRDKKAAVKRLRSAYHKTAIQLFLDGQDGFLDATAVIAEVSSRGAFVFTKRKLRKLTQLTFEIQMPLAIRVRGKVKFCEPFLAETPVQAIKGERIYRTYIEFSPNSENEVQALEDFYLKVRDDSYVATRWHRYRNELVQREIRAQLQRERMREQVKSMQEEPELATEDLLVSTLRTPA